MDLILSILQNNFHRINDKKIGDKNTNNIYSLECAHFTAGELSNPINAL